MAPARRKMMIKKSVLLVSSAFFLCFPLPYIALAQQADATKEKKPTFRAVAIRYQVTDVSRSVAFYTQRLGFTLDRPQAPPFASVSNGNITLYLSGPGSSGARPLPDGRQQKPGGWNRVVLQVEDLPAIIATLKKTDVRFRNEMETGPGGKQIQIEDPDGNPIELFEPAS
jgi:glyoxylase I family protein